MEKYVKPAVEVIEMVIEANLLTASTKSAEISDDLLNPDDAL